MIKKARFLLFFTKIKNGTIIDKLILLIISKQVIMMPFSFLLGIFLFFGTRVFDSIKS